MTIEMNEKKLHEKFMRAAIVQAKRAYANGDAPVGCVIVSGGRVIARSYNRRNRDSDATAHAELIAIKKACRKTGDFRLEGCSMYVTLEPCQMCAGALVQCRIDRVYIGAKSEKAGCAGSVIDLLHVDRFNHQVETVFGVLEEECGSMLTEFFRELRSGKKP